MDAAVFNKWAHSLKVQNTRQKNIRLEGIFFFPAQKFS